MQVFFTRLGFFSIRRVFVCVLAVLTSGSPIFCGEIHDATNRCDLPKIEALLEHNLDLVSSKDDGGSTPLVFACDEEIVKTFIAKGADVNAKDHIGRTPLMTVSIRAAIGGFGVSLGAARALLKNGADVNAKDGLYGDTALMLVSKENSGVKVVRFLLANGADVNAKEGDGSTALILASQQGAKYYGNVAADNALTAEMAVRALLDAGADVNAKRSDGITSLMMACFHGHIGAVQALLAKGANVNAKDKNGYTVLMWACSVGYRESGNPDIVQALLDKGAEVNVRANDRVTALGMAVKRGYLDVVKELVAKGAE